LGILGFFKDFFFYSLNVNFLFLKNKSFFLSFFTLLVYSIVLMLIVTLIIASLTLLERKLLSLVQRRVGPNFVGYKGRLQYLADALKLFLKGIVVPSNSSAFFFCCYAFSCGCNLLYFLD